MIDGKGSIPFQGDAVFSRVCLLPIPNANPVENDRNDDRRKDLLERQSERMERREEGIIGQRSFVEKQQTKRIDERVERMETQDRFEGKMFAVGGIPKDPMQNEPEKNFHQK